MMYIVLAVVILAIGAWDIGPVVDWVDEKNLPMALKSLFMLTLLGVIPALLIGAGIIGQTMLKKKEEI